MAFITIKMPARSVAVHPSPNAGVAAAWKSPITGKVAVSGRVQDADAICGDGIEWTLDHVSGGTRELVRGAIANGGMAMVTTRDLCVKEDELIQIYLLHKM